MVLGEPTSGAPEGQKAQPFRDQSVPADPSLVPVRMDTDTSTGGPFERAYH
jgi:hypothetical protein